MVERLVYTERVGGSNPSPPRFNLRFSIGEHNAEMLAIPFTELVRVVRFEENPADTGNAFHITTTSPRRRPGNEFLSCRAMESLCDPRRAKSAAVPFRRESGRRSRSLLACDRQSPAVRRAFSAESSPEQVRLDICRECIPDLLRQAQRVRFLHVKKLWDKTFP